MRRLLFLALSYGLLTGCIVYDEQLIQDDGTPVAETDRDRDPLPGEDSLIFLSPDNGRPGDTLIVFVDATQPELAEVETAEFFGPSDLIVLATAPNGPEEFVLTVEVPEGAQAGPNDLRLETRTGETIWVNTAFEVR